MKALKAVEQAVTTSGPADRTLITLAVITGVTSIITALVMHAKSAKQNTEQHAKSYSLLESVDNRVEKINETVTDLAADVGELKARASSNSERIGRIEATLDTQRGDHR